MVTSALLGLHGYLVRRIYSRNTFTLLALVSFRASYGITGSDAIGDYKYLTQWSSSSTPPYGGISTLSPLLHANPKFQWQVNRKLETAIEFSFLDNRISTGISYYRNRCGNQLVDFPTPTMSGFSNVTANSPALVQNDGGEFNLRVTVVNYKDFRWAINFNMALNHTSFLPIPAGAVPICYTN